MRYIATREGVEKLAGNSAVTKGQRELIQKLLHDFPDAVELFEYEDYCRTPTLGTASAFISMALDANLHEIDPESGYMQYIAMGFNSTMSIYELPLLSINSPKSNA